MTSEVHVDGAGNCQDRRVVTRAAINDRIAQVKINCVIPAASEYPVCPASTVDDVIAGGHLDQIITSTAINRVRRVEGGVNVIVDRTCDEALGAKVPIHPT